MNGVVTQYWSIIPGGIYQVLYESITGVDSFDVFGIEVEEKLIILLKLSMNKFLLGIHWIPDIISYQRVCFFY